MSKQRAFKPGLWLTVSTLIALAILISLGTWQLQRLEWKTNLIADMGAAAVAEPVALEVTTLPFTRVQVRGVYVEGSSVCVFGANQAGDVGLYRFHPIVAEGGAGLFVNLGWFEGDSCTLELPADSYNFVGILRDSVEPTSFTPAADLEGRIWYNADVAAMANIYPNHSIEPRFLDSVIVGGEANPREALMRSKLSNNHLQYAFTWFGLAGSLIAVFIALGFKRGRE